MTITKSTAVGGFVIGGLVLAVVALLLFGGTRLFTNNLSVVVYFQDSVAGLAVGAPVTLRGVKVGTVRSMKVYLKLPDLVPVIPVYLEIDPSLVSWTSSSLRANAADLALAVKAGLRAQLATQSLVTGQLSVNLDFYPASVATTSGTSDGTPEIPSVPSDVQKIKDEIADLKLPELAEKARQALNGIQQIVAELDGKVGPMADSVTRTSDAARTTLETTTAAVRQLQIDGARTLDSIDGLAKTSQNQVVSTGKEIDKALAAVERTTTKADTAIGSMNDMIAPNAPMRANLAAALRDLADSAGSLRDFSRELERNPGGTLLGRSSR